MCVCVCVRDILKSARRVTRSQCLLCAEAFAAHVCMSCVHVCVCVCHTQTYHSLPGDSHVVNTSWALLTLLLGGYHLTDSGDPPPTGKGQQPTKAHQERLEPLHRAAR